MKTILRVLLAFMLAVGMPVHAQAVSDSTSTGSLTAAQQTVELHQVNAVANAQVQLSGTWVGTVVAEGSNDGFTTTNSLTTTQGAGVAASSAGLTANGFYRIVDPTNYASIRLRVSAYTSGTIVATLKTSNVSGLQAVMSLNAANFLTTTTFGAGSAKIGIVTTDQTTHGTTDLVAADVTKVAGVAVKTGAGTASGTVRVELPTDGTGKVGLNAGTAQIGHVVADAATTGGASTFHSVTLTTTAVAVDASPGQVYGYIIGNPNATVCHVQFWDLATGDVTVGTTANKMDVPIPANGGANVAFPFGIAFATAITVAETTTDGGNTACGTLMTVNVIYK
jgi:hypothetical protein